MDKEKVIKALNQHCNGSMFDRCGKCPYYYYKIIHEPFECRDNLLDDIFTLLKEQEPVKPKKDYYINDLNIPMDIYYCGACGCEVNGKYCSNCGRAVKWND